MIMIFRLKLIISSFLFLFVFMPSLCVAQALQEDELIDSDNDGYTDAEEIISGYSPYNSEKIKIEKSDVDHDGLNDYLELKFKTDVKNPDSDEDGYKDGFEIDFAFNPLSSSTKKLSQKIEINLKTQKMIYYVGDQKWKEFMVSSGQPGMSTPKGKFKITNKITKAWSKTYKLWMPYWMGLNSSGIGIHELPVWPGGYREGENHLGKPVSHGCIRLGVGPAKYLFERISVGTEVTIK